MNLLRLLTPGLLPTIFPRQDTAPVLPHRSQGDDYNPSSPTSPRSPNQDAASLVHPAPPAERKQRSHGLSLSDGVTQFLDVYDDVMAVADCVKALLDANRNGPMSDSPRFREGRRGQIGELRDLGWDIADICNDLIPGAPAARTYQCVAYLDPFEPFPLPDDSDQTKPVSQTLTPVAPEWSGSRQE